MTPANLVTIVRMVSVPLWLAIAEAFPTSPDWTSTAAAPFKSATKWSGVSYRDHGNWVIGAPDVLLEPS